MRPAQFAQLIAGEVFFTVDFAIPRQPSWTPWSRTPAAWVLDPLKLAFDGGAVEHPAIHFDPQLIDCVRSRRGKRPA
jgi:hypothetical protein